MSDGYRMRPDLVPEEKIPDPSITLIRTVERGHIFRTEDGWHPMRLDRDEHTDVECEVCYHSVCLHDQGSEAIFSETCRKFEPELPGLEIPIRPVSEKRKR